MFSSRHQEFGHSVLRIASSQYFSPCSISFASTPVEWLKRERSICRIKKKTSIQDPPPIPTVVGPMLAQPPVNNVAANRKKNDINFYLFFHDLSLHLSAHKLHRAGIDLQIDVQDVAPHEIPGRGIDLIFEIGPYLPKLQTQKNYTALFLSYLKSRKNLWYSSESTRILCATSRNLSTSSGDSLKAVGNLLKYIRSFSSFSASNLTSTT